MPENVVTNEDLLQRLNTSDEWIQQRTGVKERRFCPPNTKPSELAHKATLNALEASGLRETDIDFIICTTQTPEHFFPGTGCYIQARLGIPGVPSLDVRDQCTGFLYGLSIADAYIRSRLDGEWGSEFGSLPSELDLAGLAQRACPVTE